jgi:hypothetical protein
VKKCQERKEEREKRENKREVKIYEKTTGRRTFKESSWKKSKSESCTSYAENKKA